MIPRFGPPVDPAQRYRLRPGAYAVLPRGGLVLLTKQVLPAPEFQLPGGGIDPGENAVQALHREVMEETGYRITDPRHIGTFRRFIYMPEYGFHAEKLCHVFLALPTLRHGAPTEPHHEVHWVAPGVALDILGNRGDRAMAARVL